MAREVKNLLYMMNDTTFLNTIQFIDFRSRYVLVRRTIYNKLMKVFSVSDRVAFSHVLRDMYLVRFSSVSSSALKKWFSGILRGSDIDFVNVLRYYKEIVSKNNRVRTKLSKKDIVSLRGSRFYEKKGHRYYLYVKSLSAPVERKSSSDDTDSNSDSDNESLSSFKTDKTSSSLHSFDEKSEVSETDSHSVSADTSEKEIDLESFVRNFGLDVEPSSITDIFPEDVFEQEGETMNYIPCPERVETNIRTDSVEVEFLDEYLSHRDSSLLEFGDAEYDESRGTTVMDVFVPVVRVTDAGPARLFVDASIIDDSVRHPRP